jgi:hypothetical protein
VDALMQIGGPPSRDIHEQTSQRKVLGHHTGIGHCFEKRGGEFGNAIAVTELRRRSCEQLAVRDDSMEPLRSERRLRSVDRPRHRAPF